MKKIDLEKQNWQNNAQYVQNKKAVSLKEFIEKYADPAIKKEIRSTAIIAYVCAGITFAVSLLFNWLGIIDALLFAGFALGMHLKKSRVCAVLMLVLGCVEVIVSLAAGRTTPPVLWLIAGIGAVAVFRKAGKQYKNFVLGSMQGSCEK